MKSIKILNDQVDVPVQFILKNAYAGEDDLVIATSSLIEGIGNKYSDLDIYVFKKALPKAKEIQFEKHHRVITTNRTIVTSKNISEVGKEDVFLVHTVIPETDIKVDVEFKTYQSIGEVAGKVASLFDYAISNLEMLSKYLNDRENSIIHRIFEAVPIKNESKLEEIKALFSREKYCYLAYRWLASDFSILLDIFGALSKNEYDRAVDICQINMKRQLQAFLHLKGCTNVDPKWMYTYLNDSKELEVELMSDEFFKLIYFIGYQMESGSEKRKYVLDCIDFCDRIYALSIDILDEYPVTPRNAKSLELLADRYDLKNTDVRSYEFMEYTYRSKVYVEGAEPTRLWIS